MNIRRSLFVLLLAVCTSLSGVAAGCATSSEKGGHTDDQSRHRVVASAPVAPLADGSVIDMHAHVFFDEAGTPNAVAALLDDRRLARLGVIVMAMPGDPDAVVAQNDQLFELTKKHPRMFAIASVHPLDGERALAEIERVKARGAKALKLHQNTQRFDLNDPAVEVVLQKAADVGLPVLFEGTAVLDPATFGKFVMLAMKHPTARIILACQSPPSWGHLSPGSWVQVEQ